MFIEAFDWKSRLRARPVTLARVVERDEYEACRRFYACFIAQSRSSAWRRDIWGKSADLIRYSRSCPLS